MDRQHNGNNFVKKVMFLNITFVISDHASLKGYMIRYEIRLRLIDTLVMNLFQYVNTENPISIPPLKVMTNICEFY